MCICGGKRVKYGKTVLQNKTIDWPSVHVVAQILCRIERGLARHVGPEEFLQCSGIVLREGNDKKDFDSPMFAKDPPGCQDPKKTCNLESYVEWSTRLKLLVANEILKVSVALGSVNTY